MSTDARCYTDQWVPVGDLDDTHHVGLDETIRRAKSKEDVYDNSETSISTNEALSLGVDVNQRMIVNGS